MAAACARDLRRSDVVALYGDLGAGKTQFVKGLCEAFDVSENVSSPTFVVLHRYRGRDLSGREMFIHHLDLYRVGSPDEVFDLGYEELFFGDSLVIVEWAERLGSLLPPRRIDVHLTFGTDESDREIVIERITGRSQSAGADR